MGMRAEHGPTWEPTWAKLRFQHVSLGRPCWPMFDPTRTGGVWAQIAWWNPIWPKLEPSGHVGLKVWPNPLGWSPSDPCCALRFSTVQLGSTWGFVWWYFHLRLTPAQAQHGERDAVRISIAGKKH